jgi:hypothetical protein
MIDDPPPTSGVRHTDRVFRSVALVYAAAFLLHNADHVRRGLDALTPEVLWAGTVSGLVAVGAIVLALAGWKLAPLLAIAHGFSQALSVAAVHLLPPWGALSDSLATANVDLLSWAAVLAEVAGAFAFGVAGAYALRLRARSGSNGDRSARAAGLA